MPGVFPGGTLLESLAWFKCARLAYTIANRSFAPAKIDTPADTFESIKTATLAAANAGDRQNAAAMGFGKIIFKNIDYNAVGRRSAARLLRHGAHHRQLRRLRCPSQPVGVNTFVHIHQFDSALNVQGDNQGMRLLPIIQVNPYGEYRHRFTFDIAKARGNP